MARVVKPGAPSQGLKACATHLLRFWVTTTSVSLRCTQSHGLSIFCLVLLPPFVSPPSIGFACHFLSTRALRPTVSASRETRVAVHPLQAPAYDGPAAHSTLEVTAHDLPVVLQVPARRLSICSCQLAVRYRRSCHTVVVNQQTPLRMYVCTGYMVSVVDGAGATPCAI